LEVIGNLFGIENNRSVEVSMEYYGKLVKSWVDKPTFVDTVWIKSFEIGSVWHGEDFTDGFGHGVALIHTRDELSDESWEREEGGSKDNWDHTGRD